MKHSDTIQSFSQHLVHSADMPAWTETHDNKLDGIARGTSAGFSVLLWSVQQHYMCLQGLYQYDYTVILIRAGRFRICPSQLASQIAESGPSVESTVVPRRSSQFKDVLYPRYEPYTISEKH